MNDDKWIVYLLLGLITYTVGLVYIQEVEPTLADQINSSVIIGLLLLIFIKMKK
ncbi:hypothetical protein [Calidifontibacillus oryziterrae]|uniref:hypothetical protein n=1 Tax=Calidifontibacillus oryziterrae TaxID=1191699 RepID=UPI0002D4F9C5|nr:hypothetical protein [Calidifontibacillus oryziterrae]